MIATEKEKISMKTEGEDYQSYIQDIIGDHKSKTSRTSIDFLIVRICDKYDGLSSFLINFCLQMLDFAFNSSVVPFDANTQISESYNLLNNPNYDFKSIIHIFNQESLIDVSLILLSSLKTFVIRNNELLNKLKMIFDTYINQLHMVGSDLIKFDVCLVYDVFLAYFMNNKETEIIDYEFLPKRLDFLFVCLMNYEKNPGTSAQAAQSITTIFKETNTDNIDSKYISNVFTQLINHIENIDISIFFDVLIEILSNCKIEENLIQAIANSTRRILKEAKSTKFKSDEKMSQLVISKCINIITTILKENELAPKEIFENDIIIPIVGNTLNIDDVENALEPLLNYLKNPIKIPFDDELLNILKCILNNTKSLTRLAKEYFQYLNMTIDKACGMDMQMFKILNLYILKDDGFIFNNHNNLQILLNTLNKALEFEDEIEFSPVCASILFQVLPNVKLIFFILIKNSSFFLFFKLDFLHFSVLTHFKFS